ncbi:MAG: hypothetical protein KCCBMMGE_00388 [Candidatus Methanoperedenaceae archaeon GB37]|nr:MAG: hypothetical protein KCCBMMGE_00388 [Candidatus Methanoperedenaceae archaeon GB37]
MSLEEAKEGVKYARRRFSGHYLVPAQAKCSVFANVDILA